VNTTATANYHHGNLESVILDLGFASARQNGISGLGVRKLAAEAGVTPSAIYRHFSNSEAIKAEISKIVRDTLAKKMLAGLIGVTDAKLRFRSLLESYLDFAFTEKHLFEISTASCSEKPKTPEEFSVWKIVLEEISNLSRLGLLKSGTTETTADFVWASAQGYASLANQPEDLLMLTREQFIDHLTAAVVK
jgi:AcrR family transcriptional regulator